MANIEQSLVANKNGNVGINVNNPDLFKLQVAGNIGPDSHVSYSIGSPTRAYASIYGTNFVGTASHASNATSASYASSASVAPLYILKAGDTFSGQLLGVTGASVDFSNSSFGLRYQGETADDFRIYLSNNHILEILDKSGSFQFSASLMTGTASFAVSASHAITASYALGISGSVLFSNKQSGYFPQWTNNRLSPTSSLLYSASALYLDGGSGSLIATASWAVNAINGGTTLQTGSTYPITASHALSASWAPTLGSGLETGSTYPITASFAVTASFAMNSGGGGMTTGSSYPITASVALTSLTASYFYRATGSGAWKIYVQEQYGDLVFDFS